MRGDLLYKCRRCGVTYSGCSVADLARVVAVLARPRPRPRSWGPSGPEKTDIHECAAGSLGVADLVGGEPMSIEAPPPDDPADGPDSWHAGGAT